MAPVYNFFQPPANTGTGLKGLTFEGSVTIGTPQTVEAEAAVLVDPINVGTGVNVVTIGGQNYLLVNVNDVVSAAGTLNALNAAATVSIAGMNGCGVFIAGGGNLVGTITPEISMDGGTTWEATYFFNGSVAAVLGVPPNGVAPTIVVSSPAASQLSIYTPPGASNARVRVSAFTSGSSTATVRATEVLGLPLNPGVPDTPTASTALGALNAAVSVVQAGLTGCGLVILGGGTLVGTLTPEVSFDGGTTWQATYFYNPTPTALLTVPPNGLARSIAVSSPAVAELTVLIPPGTSNIRVRVSAFTSGSSNALLRATEANENIQFTMALDGGKWTYSLGIAALVTVTGATDVWTIKGAANVVTRLLRAQASLTIQTAAQYVDISILKRSTADTAGTSTTPTPVPHDPQAPAAASVVNAYTANPTLGTLVGILDSRRVFAPLTGTAALGPNPVVFEFGKGPEQAHVLRAASDQIAINLNAPANAGTGDFSFTWTEE